MSDIKKDAGGDKSPKSDGQGKTAGTPPEGMRVVTPGSGNPEPQGKQDTSKGG